MVRTGFTLVEMLVATGIVVLIMSMFAQIYGTAIETITLQRGIGNNDQKARTVNTLLLSDLRAMTYRQTSYATGDSRGLVPLSPEDGLNSLDLDRQQGYFYYSENDPDNDVDDVLQFTAKVGSSATVGDITTDSSKVFLGKVGDLGTDPDDPDASEPDFDDGYKDGIGQSRAAEICYFVRGGNLYRRVLLLRDAPYGTAGSDQQPRANDGSQYYGAGNRDYSGDFWNDFDYSATRVFDDSLTGTSYLWFNTVKSLKNDDETSEHKPIALPWNRYGHLNDPTDSNSDNLPDLRSHGLPREYGSTTSRNIWIGRLTTGETSSSNMDYPGRNNNQRLNRDVGVVLNADDVIDDLADGTRFGEDLLLTNVEAFNVEYLDPSLGFVSLQSGSGNIDSFWNNLNPNYGPGPVDPAYGYNNNVFDTWHPEASAVNSAGTALNTSPPRRPLSVNPGSITQWTASNTYSTGQYVVPIGASTQRAFIYQAVAVTGSGTSDTSEPGWPTEPGGIVDDGEVTWMCIDNRIGLKAIQITIRYRDPSKQLPKQVTLVHSFVE